SLSLSVSKPPELHSLPLSLPSLPTSAGRIRLPDARPRRWSSRARPAADRARPSSGRRLERQRTSRRRELKERGVDDCSRRRWGSSRAAGGSRAELGWRTSSSTPELHLARRTSSLAISGRRSSCGGGAGHGAAACCASCPPPAVAIARRQAQTLAVVRSGQAVDPVAGKRSRGCACGASCGRRGEASCELR
ncbi:unnamed protein product, partial [Urochloa humidicola]